MSFPSISVPRRIILRTNHQTPPLLRAPINRLNNINKLLLILQHPIQLVIISCPEIAHHVFVAEEEHDGTRVVELVHGFEIGNFIEVAEVDGAEVLNSVGDLVQDFVLLHAVWVRVAPEADEDEAVFFAEDRLVDVPACTEVGEDYGAHGRWIRVWLKGL